MIKDNLLPIPKIFHLMQEASGISLQEMYQVFNMGTRLEIYTNEKTAQEIIAISNGFNIEAQIVGRVEASDKKELVIKHNNIEIVY
jgi:phosphoribosylformylglycinamidine cyclo-ligase